MTYDASSPSVTIDEAAAQVLGLFPGQLTVSIHTGSRGLGYQVCDYSLRTMLRASQKDRDNLKVMDNSLLHTALPVRT